MGVQALFGHSIMKFTYLGVTATAQEPVVAQEQDERLQMQKRLLQQGNLYRTVKRTDVLLQWTKSGD